MTVETTSLKEQRSSIAIPIKLSDAVIGILAFMTLIGVMAGVGRLLVGLRASTDLTDAYPWGIWIGFDFTLIAFAGVGFTMAAITHVFHRDKYHPVLRPALLAGFLGYGAVLMLLVLDLGRPDRFYNFIIFWNVHSPLFEISWCVLLYTTVLVLENTPALLKAVEPWTPRWLNIKWALRLVAGAMTVIAIAGVTLSSLHQSTLGTLYLNMPHRLHTLWYTPILPLLFFVSSIMAGLSLAIIAYKAAMRVQGKPEQSDIILGLGSGIIYVALLYLAIKIGELFVAGEVGTLLAMDNMSLLKLAELSVGVFIPVILWLIPAIRKHQFGQWVVPGLVLGGVLMNRFNATMYAQKLPPDVTYSPHILEWLSTIGILAGVGLVWYLGVRFLPEEEEHH